MDKSELRQLIADTLEVPAEAVTDDADSDTLEEWNSLRHLEILLAVETATGMKFTTSEMPELTSLSKIEAALVDKGWKT